MIPALSIRQPWPWLILHAGKNIENRPWSTRFRGRFYIHAAKKIDMAAYEIFRQCGLPAIDKFSTGGIVGSIELVDCITQSDSDWFLGPYGFVLARPKPIKFRPCKGQLGFFDAHFSIHSLQSG